jgi:hypothetical protein
MGDDLTNDQIALLCDIEEHDMAKATDDKRRDLDRLLLENYVELTPRSSGSVLRLTAKGAKFLGERGAGLNEA